MEHRHNRCQICIFSQYITVVSHARRTNGHWLRAIASYSGQAITKECLPYAKCWLDVAGFDTPFRGRATQPTIARTGAGTGKQTSSSLRPTALDSGLRRNDAGVRRGRLLTTLESIWRNGNPRQRLLILEEITKSP